MLLARLQGERDQSHKLHAASYWPGCSESGTLRLIESETSKVTPVICISYAGDESRIRQMPGFDKLAAAARDNDVPSQDGMEE